MTKMELEHLHKVSERCLLLLPSASHPIEGLSANIKYFSLDLCKMIKNIRETSISAEDIKIRLEMLSQKTGIHFNELIEII